MAGNLFTPVPYGRHVIGTSCLFFTAGTDTSSSELVDMRNSSAATMQANTAATTDGVLDEVAGHSPVKCSQVQVALAPYTTNPADQHILLKSPE